MKKFGILGNPLKQSPSKAFFENYFYKKNINAEFLLFECDFPSDFRHFLKLNKIDGLLVTIPHKQKAFQYADSVDFQDLESSNMLSISYQEQLIKIHAHNTDYIAFQQVLTSLNPDISKPALVIGKGGASLAICYTLDKMGISYTVWNRNKIENQYKWKSFPNFLISQLGLIINTTPLGMAPLENEDPPLNYNAISKDCIAFDLVYNPDKTLFLKNCEQQGCKIQNGGSMLMIIYNLALNIWNL